MGARARFKARNESSGIVGRCGVQIPEKRHHSVSQRHLEGELRAVKAMLSQPMAGKTDEEIVEARDKAVEALESMGYEVVNTLFTDEWYSDGAMEERGVMGRLAELVDRPTTGLSVDEDGRTCCASCGCSCLYMGSATYCPDCGAEVVRDGRQ